MISPPIVPNTGSATSTSTNTCNTKINVPRSHPCSSSADRIRSRFLHKIGIDPPTTTTTCTHARRPSITCTSTKSSPLHVHVSNDLTPASAVGECILRLEPLKISLESDDDDSDSSIGSHSDSFDDGVPNSIGMSPDHTLHIDYFHKKPHISSQEVTSISLDRQLQDSSAHSLPSLVGSDEQSAATLLSSSSHSNKKPRFLREQDKPRRKKKSVSIHKSVSVVPIPSRLEYSRQIRECIWTTAVEIQRNAARNTIEFCSESWKWQNVLEDEHMFVHQTTKELVHPIHVQNALSHIQACDVNNKEEVQLNLHLISSLVPPASVAVASSSAGIDDSISRDQGATSSSAAAWQNRSSTNRSFMDIFMYVLSGLEPSVQTYYFTRHFHFFDVLPLPSLSSCT